MASNGTGGMDGGLPEQRGVHSMKGDDLNKGGLA